MTEETDHRAVIGALPPSTRRALTTQSDIPGLVRIGVHVAALTALGTYGMAGLPLWPLAILLQGLLLTFLFAPLHETIHGTAFRSDWLNRWVAHLCGFLILLGPVHFKYFHMAHHRFTHDPERDPELVTPKPKTIPAHLVYMTGLPEWGSRVRGLIAQAIGTALPPYVPERGRTRVRRQARIYLALYAALILASIASGATALIWIWLIPSLLGQPFMRAYLLAEHTRCPHVANMLLNTRTTFTNALVRWVAWNMPFHIEHHCYPAVPFHRLPDLHDEIRGHLGTTAGGYTRFNADHMNHLAANPPAL